MLLISYILCGIVCAFLTLWSLADEPDKYSDIQSGITAIIVGIIWPIVVVLVVLCNAFNMFAKLREKNVDSPRE